MNYILFDDHSWKNLLPLTYTRPVAALRVGILSINQKWDKYLKTTTSFSTKKYLSAKFRTIVSDETQNILINGSLLPTKALVKEIEDLQLNQSLVHKGRLLASNVSATDARQFNFTHFESTQLVQTQTTPQFIDYPWDIFRLNEQEIERDFKLVTNRRKSKNIDASNRISEPENIFIEKGATLKHAILNPDGGYIYIGKDAQVMEGALIRGSFALCDHAVVKMGAKIYGATTIGPHSKVGGEISNSVIQGYSNKGHDGFLGNSVLGEWCNLGADTNTSNLKNNYAPVKVWNYNKEGFIDTGLQFCGLIMADHSKSGINTMFNTGTVVGVSANIFGSNFPRNFIPSFSWGGASKMQVFMPPKAHEVAQRMMQRRDIAFDSTEQAIMDYVFETTKKYRNF